MKAAPPKARGLYDPQWEHDACGIGAVVNISGRRDHAIVQYGKQVLLNLMHRGAAGADESTGDGAGILLQIPHGFFRAMAAGSGFQLPDPKRYGVAMLFLPREEAARRRSEQIVAEVVGEAGLKLLGWRNVPTENGCLGELARAAEPVIRQVFIGGQGLEDEALERRLYVVRKRIERRILETLGEAADTFYVPSMSCRTIVYKGMFLAPQLFAYYPDLANSRVRTALAIVHQRYSTNTFPSWRLAQPFRMIAHNGEINTLRGNANRLQSRERSMAAPALTDDMSELFPILQPGGSDSACFDNVMELLVRAGRAAPHALMMMIPEAFGPRYYISTDKRAFYEYHASIMEPWDGPAAMVFTDGRLVGGTLDRNGLRPCRYVVTTGGLLVLASEVGVIEFPPEQIRQKGRLQPGRMFLVDTEEGRVVVDNEIKGKISRQKPYRRWLEENRIELRGLFQPSKPTPIDPQTLAQRLRSFGYTREDLQLVLAPMAANSQEPVGSMGTDTPLAVLSDRPKLLFNYFKQLFAQVTNPPIDPLREGLVMSLMSFAGRQRNLLDETPEHCRQLKLPHPILTNEDMERLRTAAREDFRVATLPAVFSAVEADPARALAKALDKLVDAAERAIAEGASLLILSDRDLSPKRAPIPSLLATAALHHGLLRRRLRGQAAIVVESGEPREVMHFCLLCGYGANAVNPYLAFEAIHKLHADGDLPPDVPTEQLADQYITAVKKGILKTISKMGISTLRSYHGAQQFEAVGLGREVIDKYFTGTPSRIGGADLRVIAQEAVERHRAGFEPAAPGSLELDFGGEYYYRLDGEKHLWNPETIVKLQHAVAQNDAGLYAEYAAAINHQSRDLMTLRGLFEFTDGEPAPLDEVEPVAAIVKRFYTGAMSHGSISKEAHEILAIAMNRLGANSNTGEGGEDPRRYRPLPNGDSLNCGIKQVASAVRGHDRIPGQRADLADQDGARGEAGRGGPVAGPQGDRRDRPVAPLDARRVAHLAAAPPRHLFHRRPRPVDLRSEVRQPRRDGVGETGVGSGRGHGGGGRGQGQRRRGPHQRPRRRHRRQPLKLDQVRRHALGTRPGRNPADAGAQRPQGSHRGAGRRANEDRPRRGHRGLARRRAVRFRHLGPGFAGLPADAQVPPGHLPGRHRHAKPATAAAICRQAGVRRAVSQLRGGRSAAVDGPIGLPQVRRHGRPRRPAELPQGHRALEGEGAGFFGPFRPARPLERLSLALRAAAERRAQGPSRLADPAEGRAEHRKPETRARGDAHPQRPPGGGHDPEQPDRQALGWPGAARRNHRNHL